MGSLSCSFLMQTFTNVSGTDYVFTCFSLFYTSNHILLDINKIRKYRILKDLSNKSQEMYLGKKNSHLIYIFIFTKFKKGKTTIYEN